MKKLKVLFLSLLALVAVVSCSKDDDNNNNNNNNNNTAASLVGKWQISKEGNSEKTLEPIENEGSCGLAIVEYLQGGLFTVNGFDYEEAECKPFTDGGTWTKNGNTLTEKYADSDIYTYEIVELTNSTLKLKETDEEGTWYTVFIRK